MPELKPCPFCGGEAEYIERGNEYMGLKETEIRCKTCGTKQLHKWYKLKFDFDFVRNSTVKHWNRRTDNATD
ncbi:MAG: Lar family restriction alleviation protein [Eubacterium sp.]|nr:Lar family restriction alleviation protein [Eubacterium sp.]